MLKGVAFDMDGVLVDTERMAVEYWLKAARFYGRDDITREQITPMSGFCKEQSTAYLTALTSDPALVEKLRNKRDELFYPALEKHVPRKEQAIPALKQLKAAGLPIVLATSTYKKYAMVRVVGAGLEEYIDAYVFGDMVESRKPDPMIYNLAAKALGIDNGSIAAVEDSPVGIKSARRAGLCGILIPDLIEVNEETSADAEYVCTDLLDAAQLIISLSK